MSKQTHSSHSGEMTVIIVGCIIAVILGIAFAKELAVVDGSVAKRVVGIAFGSLLAVTGNLAPKIVSPLGQQSHKAIFTTPSFSRFAGRIFVLAGLVFIAIWAFAPHEHAMLLSSLIGLGAFALVFATWVWRIVAK